MEKQIKIINIRVGSKNLMFQLEYDQQKWDVYHDDSNLCGGYYDYKGYKNKRSERVEPIAYNYSAKLDLFIDVLRVKIEKIIKSDKALEVAIKEWNKLINQ